MDAWTADRLGSQYATEFFNSLLDVLVDATPHGQIPPFDLFKVMQLIEDATGLRPQISMRDLLKPRMAERIADDLTEVF